jgi:hypothetical protein
MFKNIDAIKIGNEAYPPDPITKLGLFLIKKKKELIVENNKLLIVKNL